MMDALIQYLCKRIAFYILMALLAGIIIGAALVLAIHTKNWIFNP